MAIKIAKADVAQKELSSRAKAMVKAQNDAAASKAKGAGSSPAVSAKELISPETQSTNEFFSYDYVLRKHKERLAYNAAYQRDLRTIKRLGLEMTVAEWRKTNAGV